MANSIRERYTEQQLRDAVTGATRWSQVNARLGRSPGAPTAVLRQVIAEYGIDLAGLTRPTRT